jgi:hypothetical protein
MTLSNTAVSTRSTIAAMPDAAMRRRKSGRRAVARAAAAAMARNASEISG